MPEERVTARTLRRINASLSAFARNQAAHSVDVPGGLAVYDDAFAHSRVNNQIVTDTVVDADVLPAVAEEALGHLPHRMISVLGDEAGTACAEALLRSGYTHSAFLVVPHDGPVARHGLDAGKVSLDAIRTPLAGQWRNFLPDVDDEVVHHLVDRREARHRGADIVHFIGAHTGGGEVASRADLYMNRATGTAQTEDLITSESRRGRGYADAVLNAALRPAIDADCGTRFLTADAADWPRHWYERRGFSVTGRSHCFERG